MINLIGEKILKKDTAFRKAISVQERLALTLCFSASDDSYVSLQYLFKISKQTISCIVLEVCEALVEKLKDYIQGRQILFVFYERILKLDCNQNFY
jgi:predicted DNA-binding protein